MTKREFMIQHKAFEEGMIRAYNGIINSCNACIRAHKKDLSRKRLEQIAQMNKHLWRNK